MTKKTIAMKDFEDLLYSLNKWAKTFRDTNYKIWGEKRELDDKIDRLVLGRDRNHISCKHPHSEYYNQCYDCWQRFLDRKDRLYNKVFYVYREIKKFEEIDHNGLTREKYDQIFDQLNKLDDLQEKHIENDRKKEELYSHKTEILEYFLKPICYREENFNPYERRWGNRTALFAFYKTKNKSFHSPVDRAVEEVPVFNYSEALFVSGVENTESLVPLEEVLEFVKNYKDYELEKDPLIESYPGDEELYRDREQKTVRCSPSPDECSQVLVKHIIHTSLYRLILVSVVKISLAAKSGPA